MIATSLAIQDCTFSGRGKENIWMPNNSRRCTGDFGLLFRVQLHNARNEGKDAMDDLNMSDRT